MGITGFKNITPGTSSNERDLQELLAEINHFIPEFIDSSVFKRDIFEESDENHYSETLIKFLENENIESRFSYKQQASLPGRRSIDIAVHLKADSEHYIFCIEAKFLPPKDYVTGDYAAIKRFKRKEHGLSHRNPKKAKALSESAIVGYSKSGTFTVHLENINNTIEGLSKMPPPDKFGLTWQITEKLQIIKINKVATFSSEHSCHGGSTIKLHHFWVSVS